MKKLLMGIDVGTTHIKAGLFDIHGIQEALSIKENRVRCGQDGCSYYEPLEIKTTVFSAISDTLKMVKEPCEVIGISVASMAEAGVPIDKQGKPLYHIITWFDQRTAGQANWWKDNFGDYNIYKETGLILQPKYSINKIMWLKDNEPDVFKNMRHWLCMEDYIIYCLSGEFATDYSIANRTMAMDVGHGEWSDKLLYIAGINKNILPSIYKSGKLVGRVMEEVSELTMLKEGTPVVTGGHDHLCAALSLGVINEGDVFDSMGTAETIVAINKHMAPDEKKFKCGFSTGRYVDGYSFYIMGGMQNSGGSIEWFVNNLININFSSENIYDLLNELSEDMKEGPSGIFYIPHLRGSGAPNVDPRARGAFIGLRSEHTKASMLKAVYEGVSYEFRLMKDSLESLSGIRVENLKIGGGGIKNSAWMRIKADVLNMDLDIPIVEESAAMGAALLAGIGTGVYKDAEQAVRNLTIQHRYIKHDLDTSGKYDLLYNNGYKYMYETLKSVNGILSKF